MTLSLFARVNLFMDVSWIGTATHFALFGFIVIYLILLGWITGHRSYLTVTGKMKANGFSTTGEEISPLAQRVCRVHANVYENFPIWGGLLIMAIITNSTSITDGLAIIFLLARLGQVITHLISTSPNAVVVRFTFFSIQYLIAAYWIFRFAQKHFT